MISIRYRVAIKKGVSTLIHSPKYSNPFILGSHHLSWCTRHSMIWSPLPLKPSLTLFSISAPATPAIIKHSQLLPPLKTLYLLFFQTDTISPDPSQLPLTMLFNTFAHANAESLFNLYIFMFYPAISFFITFNTTGTVLTFICLPFLSHTGM